MSRNKFTFFFEQVGYGWTESWYTDTGTSPPLSSANVQAIVDGYVVNRRRFLADTATLTYARYSAVQPPTTQGQKQSFVIEVQNQGQDNSGDLSFTAALCRCQDLSRLHTKNWYIRGVNDALFTDGGVFTSVNGFLKNVGTFFTWMSGVQMGWQGSTGGLQYPLVTAVQNAGNWVDITLAVNPTTGNNPFVGLPDGYRTQVRFNQIRGATQLNGQQTVIVKTTNTCRTEDLLAIFPYVVGSGYMVYAPKVVYPVEFFNIYRGVERRAGRPSFLSRGRRSASSRGR